MIYGKIETDMYDERLAYHAKYWCVKALVKIWMTLCRPVMAMR